MENQQPPKYEETQNTEQQMMEMMQRQNQPQVNNINVNVNNKKEVNHCFYGIMTLLTGGICGFCWCGACCGCCPTCQ